MLKTHSTTMKQNLEEINAFWDKGCMFHGKMTSEGIFRLDGNMEGEISHRGTLIIGETAVIKGNLETNVLILNGKLEGEVNAKERMEIHSRGKLYGTVYTPIFVIQDGGIFEGNCKMDANSGNESHQEDAGKAVVGRNNLPRLKDDP
jgi:cytoskeletal protein CcmA (bactofilin family)